MSWNVQTEPEGVPRTRTWVCGEVKFVHSKKKNKRIQGSEEAGENNKT